MSDSDALRPPAPVASGPERRRKERRRLPRRWNDKLWDVRRRYTYGIPLAFLLACGMLCLWAFWLEPSRLTITRSEINVAGWPIDQPIKVALLADIHAGSPYITKSKLQAIVEMTNRQKPDVIFLLGDYVILGVLGGHFMEPEEVADAMRGLYAPLGVYAVLGNHDWWYNGQRIEKALEDVGYTVLEDTVTAVDVNGKTLYIAGIADEWTRRSDPSLVLSVVPMGSPLFVLTHNPDTFPKLPPLLGITFAAHTHGGQVRVPFMGAPIVPSRYRQRYVRGYVRSGNQHLYVTSGIGTSVLPARLLVPPEIALITVRAGVPRTPAPVRSE